MDRFDNLVNSFNEKAKSTEKDLSQILELISNGKVPNSDLVSCATSSIDELRVTYSDICDLAQSLLSAEELPESGSSVSTYSEAVSSSRNLLKTQIEKIQNQLNRFISVKSLVDKYEEELRPFQEKARSLFDEINHDENSVDNIEHYEIASAGPVAFVNAMDCEDPDTEEGFEAIQNVGNYFPPRVVYALGANKYYFDENQLMTETTDDVEDVATDVSADVENNPDLVISDVTSITEEPIQETSVLLTDSNQNNEMSIQTPDSVDTNSEDLEVEYVFPVNTPKNNVVKASAFKKLIMGMNKAAKIILPLLTNLGGMTIKQLVSICEIDSLFGPNTDVLANIEMSVSELLRKGLLLKYPIKSEDEFVYVLSEYTDECMHKDSIEKIQNFWALSIGKYRINYLSENKMDAALVNRMVVENNRLIDYLSVSKKIYSKTEFKKTFESIRKTKDAYRVLAFVNSNSVPCLLYIESLSPTKENTLLLPQALLTEDITNEFGDLILYTDTAVFSSNVISEEITSDDVIPTDNLVDESVSSEVDEPVVEPTVIEELPQTANESKSNASEKLIYIENEADEIVVHTDNINKSIEQEIHVDSSSNYIESSLKNDVPEENKFLDIIRGLLSSECKDRNNVRSSVVDATLVAKCASFINGYSNVGTVYKQLLYASDLPFEDRNYNSIAISDVVVDPNYVNECILMSIYLRSLVAPKMAYDYGMYSQAEQFLYNYETYFPSLDCVKSLYNKVVKINSIISSGFTPAVIALLGDEAEKDRFISQLKRRASELLVLPRVNTAMANLKPMYYTCFGPNSDIYSCLEIVANNKVEELEYVKALLDDFCVENKGELIIDDSAIEEMIKNAWYDANPGNKFDLKYAPKDKIIKHANNRISTIKAWYDLHSGSKTRKYDIEHLKSLKIEIIKEANKAFDVLNDVNAEYINVLKWMLIHIVNYLSGDVNNLSIFSDFLCTGLFTLDDEYVPVLKEEFNVVKYYEPWRRALKHIESSILTLEEAKSEILDNSSSIMFDNLKQLTLIETLLKEPITTEDEKARILKADDITERFNEHLELAYTYSQISENEKESLAQLVKQHKDDFYETKDFGCWNQFLNALKAQIKELTESKQASLRTILDNTISKFDNEVPPILIDAKNLLENESESNLAVVEEYINRFDAGEREVSQELNAVYNESDYFTDFYSGPMFSEIYKECARGRDRALRNFAIDFVRKNAPKGWATRQKEDSERLISNWPTRGKKDSNKISELFKCFGFDVVKAESGGSDSTYKVFVNPSPQGQADYSHPISAFGTQMKPVIDVVVLYGTHLPRQIIDSVTRLDLGGMAVVLLDMPMTLADRRAMCELFHTQTQRQNSFILIDQVLGIYLALHQVTERIPVMLKCTLPFTVYQPFVRDGGSTSDEMFCGRVNELRTIIDPQGASIVYGGRQLGKTALLERAEKRCHAPERGSFAVYTNVYDCDSEHKFVNKIIKDINKKLAKSGLEIKQSNDIADMCDSIEDLLTDRSINSFMMFIDESDNFLRAISEQDYRPIQSLVDLKRKSNNNFKFVFAGLHNVCRFQKATENNGVFGQLGTPLCIKPLSPIDAIQLITKPLKYLGFQIDRFPHLETILTNTNYYPGILQFFGYTLVETLTSQYGKYYQANKNNPPFELQKEQLGSVMSSADLNRSIKEKFKLSLQLDKRYLMLARCIVYRYHFENDNNRWMGYSINQIKEVVASYPIHCLENTTNQNYVILLDEMVEMGILSKQNDLYRLRRGSFIDIIGRDLDKVDAEIINDNEE